MKTSAFLILFALQFSLSHAQGPLLWGMTSGGGPKDRGVIFKMHGDGSDFSATHSFLDVSNGYNPLGGLVRGDDGLLYGMTSTGGINGFGVIFRFNETNSVYTDIYNFDFTSGAYPGENLFKTSGGKMYGLTPSGGVDSDGVLFSFDPSNLQYQVLVNFNGLNGMNPYGGLCQATDGKLYGVTIAGGTYGQGVLFSFDTLAGNLAVLKNFTSTNFGSYPVTTPMQASNGKIYGISQGGGTSGDGILFSYDIGSGVSTIEHNFDWMYDGAYIGGSGYCISLVEGFNGKLYGTNFYGGNNNSGSIFSFNPANHVLNILYSFDGTHGSDAIGRLVQDSSGLFYGMTCRGGSNNQGVLYSFNPSGNIFSVVKDFSLADGAEPFGSILLSNGKLYGLAVIGGSNNDGVIFKYEPAGFGYARLYNFDGSFGQFPLGSFTQASDGTVYSMTVAGGSFNAGTLFKYDPLANTISGLYDFATGSIPYGYPNASLLQASNGKLYGTAQAGGLANGVLFSYDPVTSSTSVEHSFGTTDGLLPMGNVIQASDGLLYGLTAHGGIYGDMYNSWNGVIFNYDPMFGVYTKLKDFNGIDGMFPYGSLVQASNGLMYGMTSSGGIDSLGVLFSYDFLTNTLSKLIDFTGANGRNPNNTLIEAGNGKLYGMTTFGGLNDVGLLFSYDPVGSVYTDLVDFDGANGAYPYGGLYLASDGKIYGMTAGGGADSSGVIFSYDISNSVYTKLHDFDITDGRYPYGELSEIDMNLLRVDENTERGGLRIFPNPSTGNFFVRCKGEKFESGEITIRIYSSSGIQVYYETLPGGQSDFMKPIHLEVAAGNYFFTVGDSKVSRTAGFTIR